MKNLSWFLLSIGLFLNSNVSAQPEFDATFSSSGKRAVIFGVGAGNDGMAQPDNKILMTGRCQHIDWGQHNTCVARLNEDGSFDLAFNGRGFVYKTVPGTVGADGASYEVALQNDGKIVTLGVVRNFSSQMLLALARFNTDGTIDTSFGTNGYATAATNGTAVNPGEMVIQPDGKIVFSASNGTSSQYLEQFVYRYNADGTPDATFANNGVFHYAVPEYSTLGVDMLVQPDGKILTSGSVYSRATPPATPSAYLMTRLNPDGSPDPTFDGDGILTIPNGGLFISIALQSDGRILALGGSIHRFNSDGSVDTTFGSNGSRPAFPMTTSLGELMVTPSGKITVIGSSLYNSPINVDTVNRVARYLPDGSPDPTFSDDGFLEYEVFNGNDVPSAVFYDSKGRTGITGYVYGTSVYPQYTAARLIAPPAQNVGFIGRAVKVNGRGIANAFVTLKNGSEIIGHTRTNSFGYFRFANVPSNVTYTLSTVSKKLNFYDRSVLVDGAIENYLIVGK